MMIYPAPRRGVIDQRRTMNKLVQNREISLKAFDLGHDSILVEGTLIDHRHRQGPDESLNGPELVHHMVIRLRVKGAGMLIEKAEAEMVHHPREGCTEVLPWIRALEGVRIAPGFTMKVKKLIGGKRGCAHLTSLVIAMGESAVQGYWAAYGERARMGDQEQAIKRFVNTCHLWREDGPIVNELREALEKSAK
jgi:hypothetical protein